MKHSKPGDLIVDMQSMMRAVNTHSPALNEKQLAPFALAASNSVLYEAIVRPSRPRTWVVMSGAVSKDREQYQAMLDAEVIVLAVPKEICIARLNHFQDCRNVDELKTEILDWWHEFNPRAGKEIIHVEENFADFMFKQ